MAPRWYCLLACLGLAIGLGWSSPASANDYVGFRNGFVMVDGEALLRVSGTHRAVSVIGTGFPSTQYYRQFAFCADAAGALTRVVGPSSQQLAAGASPTPFTFTCGAGLVADSYQVLALARAQDGFGTEVLRYRITNTGAAPPPTAEPTPTPASPTPTPSPSPTATPTPTPSTTPPAEPTSPPTPVPEYTPGGGEGDPEPDEGSAVMVLAPEQYTGLVAGFTLCLLLLSAIFVAQLRRP